MSRADEWQAPPDFDWTDELQSRMVELRGGCSCHLNPPCSACCEPLTEAEADELGLNVEAAPDYLKAARDVIEGSR